MKFVCVRLSAASGKGLLYANIPSATAGVVQAVAVRPSVRVALGAEGQSLGEVREMMSCGALAVWLALGQWVHQDDPSALRTFGWSLRPPSAVAVLVSYA